MSAEADQQRQRGFRTVGSGTEGIQTKDWNAGDGADLLSAFLAASQRSTKQKIQYAEPLAKFPNQRVEVGIFSSGPAF